MAWTHSYEISLLKQNALKLARISKALGLPTVLTASMEDRVQGPLMPELEQILPEVLPSQSSNSLPALTKRMFAPNVYRSAAILLNSKWKGSNSDVADGLPRGSSEQRRALTPSPLGRVPADSNGSFRQQTTCLMTWIYGQSVRFSTIC